MNQRKRVIRLLAVIPAKLAPVKTGSRNPVLLPSFHGFPFTGKYQTSYGPVVSLGEL